MHERIMKKYIMFSTKILSYFKLLNCDSNKCYGDTDDCTNGSFSFVINYSLTFLFKQFKTFILNCNSIIIIFILLL